MPKKKRGFGFTHRKTGRHVAKRDRGELSLKEEAQHPSANFEQCRSPSRTCESAVTPENFTFNYFDLKNTNTSSASGTITLGELKPVIVKEELCEEEATPSLCGETVQVKVPDLKSVYDEALNLFQLTLPTYWRVIQGCEGFHLVSISKGTKNISVQREVFASFSGDVEVFVHTKLMSKEFHKKLLEGLPGSVPLSATSVKSFVDRNVKVVLSVRSYEICAGSDKETYAFLWKSDESGYIDTNPYQECRYVKTFRSYNCFFLVPVSVWSCIECKKAIRRLVRRYNTKHRCET